MKLKLDEKGNAVLQDGKPVYQDDSGADVVADFPAALTKIAALNSEAKQHRLDAKAANEKLAAFGDLDPAAATKAMQLSESMAGKKVLDDEGIQKLVAAAVKPLQEKLNSADKTIAEKDAHVYKLEVSNRFASSAFIKENLVLPPDIAEATFGKAFKIEGGKVVALDASGNQIFSKARPGEAADFEESIAAIVAAYPAKDAILKAKGASGSGAPANNGGHPAEAKTITRAEFEKLPAGDQMSKAKSGVQITD